MSSSAPELQPDVDEVLQSEGYGKEPEVKVCVTKPVRTQELPAKAAGDISKPLPAAGAKPLLLLRADPRRKVAIIMANADMRVTFSSAASESIATRALWLVGRELRITAVTDIFVCGDSAGGTVSAIMEYWAVGEDGGE